MTLIDEVAALILGVARDRPTRALIDGRSASGKTTFASVLGEALARSGRQVVTVHFDDFHPVGYRPLGSSAYTPARYLEEGFDFAAFERLVLMPTASSGTRRVTLSLPGATGAGSDDVLLAKQGLLLVEGAFLLQPQYRRWWDVAIWLDVSFETMIERAVARDVAWVGDAQKVRARYETFWRDAHALYDACAAREAAHVVLNNEAPDLPALVRWSPPNSGSA